MEDSVKEFDNVLDDENNDEAMYCNNYDQNDKMSKILTANLDPSKLRLPKSTVNFRHHTDSHFRSDTCRSLIL